MFEIRISFKFSLTTNRKHHIEDVNIYATVLSMWGGNALNQPARSPFPETFDFPSVNRKSVAVIQILLWSKENQETFHKDTDCGKRLDLFKT